MHIFDFIVFIYLWYIEEFIQIKSKVEQLIIMKS